MDKILIIQDSPSINAMLKFKLEPEGFFVETVETGEDGVKKAVESQYQLILLDINLPGINGVEVCRILRAQKNTGNTPVVFMSARDEDEISKSVKDVGADGYIGIPFEEDELIEKVRGFIKSRKL